MVIERHIQIMRSTNSHLIAIHLHQEWEYLDLVIMDRRGGVYELVPHGCS